MLSATFGHIPMENIDDRAYSNLDKRGSQEPVPTNLEYYLTDLQLQSLHHLEEFGWQLAFVRRPLFVASTVVLLSPEGKQHATIGEDGGLILEPALRVRQDNDIQESTHYHYC